MRAINIDDQLQIKLLLIINGSDIIQGKGW